MKKVNLLRLLVIVLLLIIIVLGVPQIRKMKLFKGEPEVPVKEPIKELIEVLETPKPPEIAWKEADSFDGLAGWDKADFRPSLKAFQVSCAVFLRQPENKEVGTKAIPLKVKDWYPACRAALKLSNPTDAEAKTYFETWFNPGRFYDENPIEGLFTGYYVPVFDGSLKRTDEFPVPMYGLPRNWVTFRLSDFDENAPDRKVVGRVEGHHIYPFHTRAEINRGAIERFAPVIVWVRNQVDRLFLEIQGSGLIKLPSGREIFIGYAGQNGAAYTSIAGVLIRRGEMTTDNASMQNIRAYFKAHPDEMQGIINENKSFVFFQKQQVAGARGAQGVFLTPGYSLAVDRAWVPLGTPLWLQTTRPDETTKAQVPLERLFIAQDTGGAIKGPVRGDVFWGGGDAAGEIAGRMKNKGMYWIMLPRATPRGENAATEAPKK